MPKNMHHLPSFLRSLFNQSNTQPDKVERPLISWRERNFAVVMLPKMLALAYKYCVICNNKYGLQHAKFMDQENQMQKQPLRVLFRISSCTKQIPKQSQITKIYGFSENSPHFISCETELYKFPTIIITLALNLVKSTRWLIRLDLGFEWQDLKFTCISLFCKWANKYIYFS